MSDINIETDANNKNNELVVNAPEEAISENIWIIGVSKTHPGLKYYFNTITGVSLWNISREDMERAKKTMKTHRNEPLYINCPEPKDPPPSKRISINQASQSCCEHISDQSKSLNKQSFNSRLARESPGFTCDVCYGSVKTQPNVITVNFRTCPHPSCNLPHDHACSTVSPSQIQSSSALLDTSSTCNNLLGSKKYLNRSIADLMVDDSSNHLPSNQNSESINHNTSQIETLDLTPLKMFAKNVIKDKWYIIADADVYLHHISLIKSVINSDNTCCLMVPQNVKDELENATKTELRTKAHCASYYIYKMFDCGRSVIDEDGSKHINIQEKSNEEHILNCCSKLNEQNLYVVVISNDIELQKYRYKIYIPIFTVAELKEYLYKGKHFVIRKPPEPEFNLSLSSKNIKVPTPNKPNNNLPDIRKSIITNLDVRDKVNQNIQTSTLNDNGTQVEAVDDVSKITADAEVQTNSTNIENIHKNAGQTIQNDDNNKRKEFPISESCASSLLSGISGPNKRIKLRRRKVLDQTGPNLSTELDNLSESRTDISSNENLLLRNNLEERNKKNIISKVLKPNEKNTTPNSKQKMKECDVIPNQPLKVDQGKAVQFKSDAQIIENKNVMFEVTSEMMDQSLRRKCDEWVSRFVQIMEEALTQVLRKNSSLYLPPPWNMYEAAICIEKKFSNDEDVADASKKFLNILNQICNEKGSIHTNISPTQYMEMYSFGVYIIDALQGIFSKCEDLQTAAESLSKLLSDIQDPESDITNLEQFRCISQEEGLINDTDSANDNVEVLMIIDTESISDEKPTEATEFSPILTDTITKENILTNDNTERPKKQFTITAANTEFSNNGISNEGDETSQEDKDAIFTETIDACNTFAVSTPNIYNLRPRRRTLSSEKQFERSSNQFNNDTLGLSHKVTTISKEPKIVRNFVICPEFEDRFRNGLGDDTIEELDYEEEWMATDYVDEELSPSGTERFRIEEFPEYHDNGDGDVDEHVEQEVTRTPEYVTLDFKYFIRRIAQEIKELSSKVYTFSRNSCESLNSLSTIGDKRCMRERAEQVHLCIDKLCTTLTNIINRDKNGGYNMQALLKRIEFDDILIDEDQMNAYRTFIARCLEQAHDLKNTIEDVLSAVC